MISKSFLKSSVIYTIGGAMPMLSGLILLPFYTNYLSSLQYTQVAFYIIVSLLMQILFSYSIDSYFGVKYSRLANNPEMQKNFIGTVSVLLLSIGGGLLLLSAVFGDLIFKNVFNPQYEMGFWPYGFWSVLTAFFNSYFKTASNALIYLEKPKLFLISNFVNFVATIGISVGGLFLFPDSIVGPIYGRLLSGVIIFFIAQYIYSISGHFKLEKSFLKELGQFCTPYVFYVTCVWFLGYTDRFILQEFIPNTDLNTYDLVLKCFFGIEFVQNSLTAIFYPRVYQIWTKENSGGTTKESNRYFNVFTALNVILLILFCLAVPVLYKLVIKEQTFHNSEKYIGVLAAGYALRSIIYFYMSVILYTRSIKALLKIFAVSALVQLAVTWFSVSYFGLYGAIYSGLAVKVIQIGLSYVFTRNIFNFEFNFMKIFGIPFLYLLVNVTVFSFYKEYSLLNYILQLIGFGILFYFIFKKELISVLKTLPEK